MRMKRMSKIVASSLAAYYFVLPSLVGLYAFQQNHHTTYHHDHNSGEEDFVELVSLQEESECSLCEIYHELASCLDVSISNSKYTLLIGHVQPHQASLILVFENFLSLRAPPLVTRALHLE